MAACDSGEINAVFAGTYIERLGSLPIDRASKETPIAVPHFIDVICRQLQAGAVQHHIIRRILGILHRA